MHTHSSPAQYLIPGRSHLRGVKWYSQQVRRDGCPQLVQRCVQEGDRLCLHQAQPLQARGIDLNLRQERCLPAPDPSHMRQVHQPRQLLGHSQLDVQANTSLPWQTAMIESQACIRGVILQMSCRWLEPCTLADKNYAPKPYMADSCRHLASP